MKHKTIKLTAIAVLTSAFVAATVSFSCKKSNVKVTHAATLPTTLDLHDNTNEEIVDYYSSLSSLPASELSGINLLKNLKGIISNVTTYYSYGSNVPNIYTITDRDWERSPISSLGTGTYNPDTETVTGFSHNKEADNNNPYIHMLYCDYNTQSQGTRYKAEGDVDKGTTTKTFDNEHVWSQSHGFYKSGTPLEGAGTDLHHLIAGTQYGNRTLHNNLSYGFVKENDSSWASAISQHKYPYEEQNKRGEPLFAHSQDQENKVFEPQDCDKGDIARAMLYMAACYNNLDGSTPTPSIPALTLQNYVIGDTTGYSSEDITKGYYGVLQDLLAWHKMDPVDDYEIHRNNIIYNTYQHNRNPFIDYPQWVDYIWGTSNYDESTRTITYDPTSTGSVDLDLDEINGYRGETVTALTVTSQPSKTRYLVNEDLDKNSFVITATFANGTSRAVTNKCAYTYDFSSLGTKTVVATYEGFTTSFTVKVVNVVGLSINQFPSKTEYKVGETLDTDGLVVMAEYSDSSSEDVTSRTHIELITFDSVGVKTINISYANQSTSFQVTVRAEPSPDEPTNNVDMKTILIYVAIGVGAVLLIVGILTGVVKVSKKGKVKVSKSGVKKVVKKTTKKKEIKHF